MVRIIGIFVLSFLINSCGDDEEPEIIGRCKGNSLECHLISDSYDCERQMGCDAKVLCKGQRSECDYPDSISCGNTIQGCYWKTGECTGESTDVNCDTIESFVSCLTNECSWNNYDSSYCAKSSSFVECPELSLDKCEYEIQKYQGCYITRRCEGEAVDCKSFWTELSCYNQSGCYWDTGN